MPSGPERDPWVRDLRWRGKVSGFECKLRPALMMELLKLAAGLTCVMLGKMLAVKSAAKRVWIKINPKPSGMLSWDPSDIVSSLCGTGSMNCQIPSRHSRPREGFDGTPRDGQWACTH